MKRLLLVVLILCSFLTSGNAKVKVDAEWMSNKTWVMQTSYEKMYPFWKVALRVGMLPDSKTYFYFLCIQWLYEAGGSFNKDSKMLLRSGDEKVYEGYCANDYNEYKSKVGLWVDGMSHDHAQTEYEPMEVLYQLEEDAVEDFAKTGIIKIRFQNSNGLYNFEYNDKRKKNAQKVISEMLDVVKAWKAKGYPQSGRKDISDGF